MFKMPTYDPISIAAMSFGILLAVVWLWRFNAVVDDDLRAPPALQSVAKIGVSAGRLLSAPVRAIELPRLQSRSSPPIVQ